MNTYMFYILYTYMRNYIVNIIYNVKNAFYSRETRGYLIQTEKEVNREILIPQNNVADVDIKNLHKNLDSLMNEDYEELTRKVNSMDKTERDAMWNKILRDLEN